MTREEATMGVYADGGHNMDWGDGPWRHRTRDSQVSRDTEGAFNKTAGVKAELSVTLSTTRLSNNPALRGLQQWHP